MPDQNLARGAFVVAVALFFGLGALRYPIGTLARTGPGLFPVIVSGLLLVLGLLMLVQSRLAAREPLQFNVGKIALVMLGLGGFVVVARYVSMLPAILVLVFVVSYAGTAPSWRRSLGISAGLAVIAFLFQRFLGLNLRLV
ncbi:tripartite tricarboxylate transporter TctB family protein [Methylobacterium sp. A49B]|nr:tripartite tricarboxylate transporter TctB family protein [Methylobacterium mesophilicum]MBE7243962.1 tripartite tricarboxylate transporter TctB family protein [Actinomycetospora chiangmaiensis]